MSANRYIRHVDRIVRDIKGQLSLTLTTDDSVTVIIRRNKDDALFLINIFGKWKETQTGYKMESVAPLGGIWLQVSNSGYGSSDMITINWTMDILSTPTYEINMDSSDTDITFGTGVTRRIAELRDNMKKCLEVRNMLNLSSVPLTLMCKIKDSVYFFVGEWRRVSNYYVAKAKNKAILVKYRVNSNENSIRNEFPTVIICNSAIMIRQVIQFFDYRSPSEAPHIEGYDEIYDESHSFCISIEHAASAIRAYIANGSLDEFIHDRHSQSERLSSIVIPRNVQSYPSDPQSLRGYDLLEAERRCLYEHDNYYGSTSRMYGFPERLASLSPREPPESIPIRQINRRDYMIHLPPRLLDDSSQPGSYAREIISRMRFNSGESLTDPPIENLIVTLAQNNLLELAPGVKQNLEELDQQSALSPKLPQPDATSVEDMIKQITCVVCMSNRRDAVTLPCSHNNMCYVCALTIYTSDKKQCPICRAEIKQVLQIYS